MVLATNLGFPRVGIQRELKKALEAYWKGKSSKEELTKTAKEMRLRHWNLQKEAGLDHIPSNDFCLYDHVLSMSATLGCIPERFGWDGGAVTNDLYFAMARGTDDAPAMEMTKWYDTNYHYIVPEFTGDQEFKLSCDHIFNVYQEAKDAGIETRPVLVGPATYLSLGKDVGADFCPGMFIQHLVPVYEEILIKLREMGCQWVQIDEPLLARDMPMAFKRGLPDIAAMFARVEQAGLKICLTTYFDGLRENVSAAFDMPVSAVHVDLVRAPAQLDKCLDAVQDGQAISLGLIDGRNIWKTDLSKALEMAEKAVAKLGADRVMIGPSCSLLHTPIDVTPEDGIDPEIKNWLAFATQKLIEIKTVATGAAQGRDAVADELAASDAVVESRRTSTRIHNQDVKKRVAAITPDMMKRKSPYAARHKAQQDAIKLPLFPTTSIGSFPQTTEIRQARAAFKKGTIDRDAYEAAMRNEIAEVIKFQEEIGMDVLVHGEPERNDMVEYFGEQLDGFAFTKNAWVQSYGSRCVKPPIIFGDVSRPRPMTVAWSTLAQSLTDKPVKGMLTGPITILQWSFVRDDQPRHETSRQIALAIRDEVADLEKAGIAMIQIDEAALREGLPLRPTDWKAYLDKAVEDFRLASCCVADETQIHTHMCYSDFNEIIDSIAAMDADVISIETSRSHMELLEAFDEFKYPNEIGPGVYDIHSPRVPDKAEMVALLEKAAAVIPVEQLWVNPDCGLKTRGWAEVKPALQNMVEAAKDMRTRKAKSAAA